MIEHSSHRLRVMALVMLVNFMSQLAGCASEQSVKPGINERWRSSEIEPLIGTLESESREIYVNRELLAAVAAPRPGSAVADVGAGSGFMSEQFARIVGPSGVVYAVDINPVMMQHVARKAAEKGIENIETVVCTDTSVNLPPGSVDMIFICDTYHHFEYPVSTMRTIHRALRPGGEIVLVEFTRDAAASGQWIMDHVRAGREVFVDEITAAGFELVDVHDVPFLRENYVIRFRKIDRD